jgi:hypothetical protein
VRNLVARRPRIFIAAVAVAIAVVYYEAVFDRTFSSVDRFDLILGVLFAQAFGLVALAISQLHLMFELRSQHRAATNVATVRGLWSVLEKGAEEGEGLTIELRRVIYRAGNEAFEAYDRSIGNRL